MLKQMLFGLGCLTLSMFASAQEISIPTARGEVALNTPIKKIAVFDTGTLDTLQALGVKVDGAPDVGKLIPYLKPLLAQAKNVGTIFEPNMEALNELQPDLIIVGTRSAKKFDEVSQLATTIDLTDSGNNLIESGLKRIDSLGKLFNKPQQAEQLKHEITTLFKQTQEAAKNKGNGLIILVNGGKISAFGSGYRLSFIHNELGIPMADPSINATGHGQPISFEFIEKTNPDWLFVLDRLSAIGQEGKSAQEVLDNELVRRTNAWKNGHVVYLSSASYLASGGAQQLKTDLNIIKSALEKK